MGCSLPGSSVRGILQARILEWAAVPFSRGSSQPRDWTQVLRIAGGFFTVWATREAMESNCSWYKNGLCGFKTKYKLLCTADVTVKLASIIAFTFHPVLWLTFPHIYGPIIWTNLLLSIYGVVSGFFFLSVSLSIIDISVYHTRLSSLKMPCNFSVNYMTWQ